MDLHALSTEIERYKGSGDQSDAHSKKCALCLL